MDQFIETIPNMVEGMELKKGSIILIHFWGENNYLELLDLFAIEIAKQGAIPVKWQYSQNYLKDFYSQVMDDYELPEKFFQIFEACDVVIDLCVNQPSAPHKDFPKEKFSLYANYMKKLFSILTKKETFIQVKVPTKALASQYKIDYNVLEKALIAAYKTDYTKLKFNCDKIISQLQGKKNMTIISNPNYELTFQLGERSWFKDCGDGDIPSGEVYIAPIEETVNGKVCIPTLFLEGKQHSNTTLAFKNGELIHCSHDSLMEYLKKHPGDSTKFGEFGIGLNEQVKELIGYPALDEKCFNTVHIALGMNTLFGGTNESPLHIDFVFKPCKITADDLLIYEEGSLLI